MTVEADGPSSIVKIVTDYNVAGRVAQFGRGVMEDVSRRIVNDMAACIKANVEAAEPGAGGGQSQVAAGPGAAPVAAAPPVTSKPVNAFGLLFSVLWSRVRGLFGARQ
jgi:hypothetical protein